MQVAKWIATNLLVKETRLRLFRGNPGDEADCCKLVDKRVGHLVESCKMLEKKELDHAEEGG